MDASNTKTVRDLLQNAAEEHGKKVFLKFEDNDNVYDVKYGEFYGDCERIAAWMAEEEKKAGHPVHIALLGNGGKEYMTVLLAIMMSGSVAVPIDTSLDIAELRKALDKSASDKVFYEREFKALVETAVAEIEYPKEIYMLEEGRKNPCIGDILEKYKDSKFEGDFSDKRCALILGTAGTSGRMREVMLSQGNLLDNVFAYDMPGRQDDETVLSVIPPWNISCIIDDILTAMRYGTTVCLNRGKKNPSAHFRLFNPTTVRLSPQMIKNILREVHAIEKAAPDRPKMEITEEIFGKNLRRIISLGQILNPSYASTIRSLGIEIGQFYTMSEASSKIAAADWENSDRDNSVGKAVKDCLVEIEDGELIVKSPSVMMGYYKDSDETLAAIDSMERLHTGDLAYIDEEGYIYITGRKENRIEIEEGIYISPEKIEQQFEDEELVEDILIYKSGEGLTAEIYPDYDYADEKDIKDIDAELTKVIKNINAGLENNSKVAKLRIRKKPFRKTYDGKIIRSAFYDELKNEKERASSLNYPDTDLEQKIYDLAAKIMGVRRFGVDMNLYETGLDSRGSIRLLDNLYRELSFELTLEELMENPTVAGLEKLYWDKNDSDRGRFDKRESYPLSFAQQYFTGALGKGSSSNQPYLFKLSETINLKRLKRAAEQVFEIHPELKCIIRNEGSRLLNYRDDSREIEIPIMIISDNGWEKERQKLLSPYSYDNEELFRALIIQTESAAYFFFDLSKAMGDVLTVKMLFEDLNLLYRGEKPVKVRDSYYEKILSEQEYIRRGDNKKDEEGFLKLMEGYRLNEAILLRADYSDEKNHENIKIEGRLEAVSRQHVKEFCRENAISENSFFLAAFNLSIAVFNDSRDTVCNCIHDGRTDNRWNRAVGPFFRTYLFRSKTESNETVAHFLKSIEQEMLENMRRGITTLNISDMVFQYHEESEKIDCVGDAKAEQISVDTDDLPFCLNIIPDEKSYGYILNYWENRFDANLTGIFVKTMNYIASALMEEYFLAGIRSHLGNEIFPKHFYISAGELNASAGNRIVTDVGDKEQLKVYVLDENYEKKPFGAWGTLYVLNHSVEGIEESIAYPYAGGKLYRTDRKARITPEGKVDFIENVGKSLLLERVDKRSFPDLIRIEKAIKEYPAIKDAHAYIAYGENNEIRLVAEIESMTKPHIEDLQRYIAKVCGEDSVPSEFIIGSEEVHLL